MAASMGRAAFCTGMPSRSRASGSTVRAGSYSASMTTGERPGEVMRMSGRLPDCPAMTRLLSKSTLALPSMGRNRFPRTLLALPSAWWGMAFPDAGLLCMGEKGSA